MRFPVIITAYICCALFVSGQVTPAPPLPEAAHLLILRDRFEARKKIDAEIEVRRARLSSGPPAELQAQLESEIRQWQERRVAAEEEFTREATGIQDIATSGDSDVDLQKQAKQVVKPALDALEDLMKQPREINDLERSLKARDHDLPQIRRAIISLEETKKQAEAALHSHPEDKGLTELKAALVLKLSEYRTRLTLMESERLTLAQRLEDVKNGRQSFGQVASRLWSGFVLQRLLNLVLACAAFAGVLLALRWFHRCIGRQGLRRKLGIPVFLGRAMDVLYYMLSTVAALGAAFVVLYLSGDWLLLTLGMLMVAGLALLSRHSLPRLYEQARIMLNLGAIREGERVLWHGLPWLVRKLHVTCELHNPSLTGGTVLLPLREVADLISRQYGQKERWFACEEGEWVELSDGVVGKVILQTPEMVQLVRLGGSFHSYTIPEFLRLAPRNLSHNFRIISHFGIDYSHASLVHTEVPEAFTEALRTELARTLPAHAVLHITVELADASLSALEMAVIVDFAAPAAPFYPSLPRLMQRTCVAVCLQRGWTMPVAQLMLHHPRPDVLNDEAPGAVRAV